MFLDKFSNHLFRPLSSPNARAYGVSLWALYDRLVLKQTTLDECTPKEAREIIHLSLIEHKQQVDWGQEGGIEFAEEQDDAARIYRYLRECGWLKEIDDIGYRKTTYFPHLASQLLAALNSIKHGRSVELGSTCQGVYSALKLAVDNPQLNATQISFAATAARNFNMDLMAMTGCMREVAHRILEGESGLSIVHVYFREFLQEILLDSYSKLKTQNHPYRYREVTITQAIEIANTPELMDALVEGVAQTLDNPDPEGIEAKLLEDLYTIQTIFENVEKLLERIEHYRRSLTKRAREAMQYTLTAVPDFGLKIDATVKLINQLPKTQDLPYPGSGDHYLSENRLYVPRGRLPEPEPTPIKPQAIPYEAIAYSWAKDHYLRIRQDNPKRIFKYLAREMGDRYAITTDDLTIDSLDDYLAFLQLRNLLHNAVPENSVYRQLLRHFKLTAVPNELTENEYLVAPKIRIERLTVPTARRSHHVA